MQERTQFPAFGGIGGIGLAFSLKVLQAFESIGVTAIDLGEAANAAFEGARGGGMGSVGQALGLVSLEPPASPIVVDEQIDETALEGAMGGRTGCNSR